MPNMVRDVVINPPRDIKEDDIREMLPPDQKLIRILGVELAQKTWWGWVGPQKRMVIVVLVDWIQQDPGQTSLFPSL